MIRRGTLITYAALIAGIVISAVSVSGLLVGLRDQSIATAYENRDDLVWYSVQFRFEINDAIDTIERYHAGEPQVTHDDVLDRFDVVWSRLTAADQGLIGQAFMELDGARDAVEAARASLDAIEPAIAVLERSDDDASRALLQPLRGHANAFRGMALSALERRQSMAQSLTEAVVASAARIEYLMLGVLVFGAALTVLLLSERRKIEILRQDLAQRYEVQTEELRESEQRFRLLVEHAPEAIVVLDVDLGVLVDANANAEALFGRARDDLLGQPVATLIHACQPGGRLSPEVAMTHIQAAVEGQFPVFEWTVLDGQGDAVPTEFRLARLPAGERRLVRGSITNIAERQRAERELARHRELLEERVVERTRELVEVRREVLRSERLAGIGELIGTVSHELRNPLGTISASFAALRSRITNDDPQVQSVVARIDRNIVRCDRIIQELLDYARMQELTRQDVNIDRWLRSITEEAVPANGVTVVQGPPCGIEASIDPERLRQAVANLVQNAVQAFETVEDDGRERVVRLDTSVTPEQLTIEVSDTGPGLDPGTRDRIFEPLFSTRSFGIGLGLPLVRRVVEQHGGSVVAGEAPGEGARFTIRLPRTGVVRTGVGTGGTGVES